ncbi:MAG: hypothetical protein EOO15_07655 [Chitinophagaceae bacterium]|nr:MAG: hypothetical protein EOO15_07655 [Chitinophagaceae bacterium]
MNRKSTLFALLLLLGGCTKNEYFRTSSYLLNKSAHQVVVTPWLRDSAYLQRRVVLRPGDSTKVFENSGPEKAAATTWGEQLRDFDSLQVWFIDTTTTLPADTARIAHIRQGLSVSYPKHIPYSGPRSLYNRAAWMQVQDEETKYMMRTRFLYTFTELDYQAAR